MMPLERRNEAQMLRSFWQPLLYKRYNELVEARAFNEWLENRTLCKEGEEYTDAVDRPAAAEVRPGVRRAVKNVAAGRNTQESGVVGGIM